MKKIEMASTNSSQRRKWSKEEVVLAFELYCQTPNKCIDKRNKDIVRLASILERTPAAVALKLWNLACCDPDYQTKRLSGLPNGSKIDKEVFLEYYQNLEELSLQACSIRRRMGIRCVEEEPETLDFGRIPQGDDIPRLSRQRRGQSFFRETILTSYDYKCCVTDLSLPCLLIASHIKPWAISERFTEKTNPRNGLCLNAFHDRAFDQGLFTLSKDYKIVVSSQLKWTRADDNTRDWFMSYQGKSIRLPDKFLPSKEFIEYHNDVIFKP